MCDYLQVLFFLYFLTCFLFIEVHGWMKSDVFFSLRYKLIDVKKNNRKTKDMIIIIHFCYISK